MLEQTLDMMKAIDESNQPTKQKIAKKAAMLVSFNDTAWNYFKNDPVFNATTLAAQRQLISRTYRTNKELSDYDAENIVNYANNSTFTSSKRGRYTSNYFKK
jgi:hypothetical protein